MNLKKVMAMFAVIAICLTSFVVANAATGTAFSDVPANYDYSNAVEYLKDETIVEGYSDGTYKPANTINRAEFVKIVLLARGETPEGGNCFPDVTGQWYAPYVCKAKDLGIISGYPDGTFKPERPINFIESGKVVTEGLNLPDDDTFQDGWYHKYVKAVEAEKAIPLSVDTFDKYIDRGEMAEMIWRVQTNQNEASGTYEDLNETTYDNQVHEISSCSALTERFEDIGSNYYGYYDDVVMLEAVDMAVEPATAGEAKTSVSRDESEAAAPGGSDGDVEYSTTNIQVEGVDEADIVKTDGEYVYIVKGDTVRVIKAYHPDDMEELEEISFSDDSFYPTDMYVDGDKLVVVGTSYHSYNYPMRGGMPEIYPYYGGDLTKIYILDISDKSNVEVFRKLSFEGSYDQSRKVDEMVYLVLNRYTFWPYEEILDTEEILPRYVEGDDESKQLVDCTGVKYIPSIETSNYLIVVGVPIDDDDADIAKEVVLGSSENVYSSRDNLYVASTDWNYYSDTENTNIYKFELGRNNIDFEGKGRVPGRILNQFSMDEYDDHFRIATTKGQPWDGTSTNNVYVLDDDVDMVGKLEGIAPGESIYSTRFLGKRLYMVTFKKIDPFFVIDMSDHKFPEVLGKLKIPGYSDYLHPYDENHIIGFGKDTVEPDEWEEFNRGVDFEWYQGIKIALFDVTDVENPKQMFKEIIGDRGTDSPLLRNHKALLFDKEKNLLSFPVTVAEIPEEEKDPDLPLNTYGDYVFQGAYVYGLDLINGFDLKATISHYDNDEVEDMSGYYWYGDKDIERVLYIGDFLYTISKGMVKANDMTADYEEVNSVEVGGAADDYYYYYE